MTGLRSGELIAERFLLEELADQGGPGLVYRASDQHTHEPAAIKLLRKTGHDWLERFSREAKMLAELRHPHIVEHIAHGSMPSGELYLAMEWLDGENLDDRLKREPLVAGDAVLVAITVAEVLAVVHGQNIIHRDIKPSNLFLCDRSCEKVKLLDFGIARATDDWSTLTGAGIGIGTPGYMAPEQVLGWKDIDGAADIFSLGVVLYECLTGERCYPGGDVSELLWTVPAHVRSLVPQLPPALDSLVASMILKDASARPNAETVAEQLRAIASEGGLSSQPDAIAITRSEQHFISVVVVKGKANPNALPDDTLPRDGDATTRLPGGPVMLTGDAMTSPAARVAAASGARIGRLADGSLAAFYTGQGAAVDLAERAARCALSIKEVVGETPVGVCTDSSVTTGRLPVREIMERSGNIMRDDDAGIRVDETTASLLENRFEVRGQAPSFELVSARKEQGARTLLGKRTRCVGRKRELSVLQGMLEECSEERVASAALVTGPAGIGKSRIRHEIIEQITNDDALDVRVLLGRGDPMSAGAPFGILGSATRAAMGILDGDPRDVRLGKLAAAVGVGPHRENMTAFLGEIVGTPLPRGASAQLDAVREDPKVLADQIRATWRDWITQLCAESTVLLILEDLHWGDVATVKLIDSALRTLRDQPFMVLAMARPEVHDLFPKLWADRELQEIRVGPLRARVAETLVREVLGDGFDEAHVETILKRADGNPFFLEELIRAARTRGISDEVPDSVIAMMQARLRALPGEARRVLRASSVFGEVFWDGAARSLVSDLSGDLVDEWLKFLEAEELVVRRAESAHPGESEYEFRHSLVREAAYSTLTDEDRAAGHRLAGEWLEASGGTHGAAVLAEHYERGKDPERAVVWYRRAADQAAATDDPEASIRLAQRGIDCGATGEDALMLQLIQADESIWQGRLDVGMKAAEKALAAAPPGSIAWFRATRPLAISYYETGANEKLVGLGRDVQSLIDEVEPIDTAVWCVASVADLLYHVNESELADRLCVWVKRFEAVSIRSRIKLLALSAKRAVAGGDIVGFLRFEQEAAKVARANGLHQRMLAQMSNIGAGYIELGAYDRAEKTLIDGVPMAERYDAQKWRAWLSQNLGVAVARLGRLDEGIALHVNALAQARTWKIMDLEGQASSALALIYCWNEQYEKAETTSREAVKILHFSKPLGLVARSVLAHVLLSKGDPAAALEETSSILEQMGSDARLWELDTLFRLTHARALWETGSQDRAREAIAHACELLEAAADKVTDPELKRTFLAVPENAETQRLAGEWR